MLSILGRAAVLLCALLLLAGVSFTATSGAQDLPQCMDGVDNDSDNFTDGADAGCGPGEDNDESDSPYANVQTIPLPLVTLQGTVTRKGVVKVKRLEIRAQRGSTVRLACSGKRCPKAIKSLSRIMLTSTLRLKPLERKLKPGITVTLRIVKTGQLGKYVRYKVRRKKPPLRTDRCLDQDTGKVRGCFSE